jgi:hypothetical protein
MAELDKFKKLLKAAQAEVKVLQAKVKTRERHFDASTRGLGSSSRQLFTCRWNGRRKETTINE